MPQFPQTESEIVTLGQKISAGIGAHIDIYPEPPVLKANLDTLITAVTTAQNQLVAAKAAAEAAVTSKMAALEAMADAMKKDIRYAENTVGNDNDKLMLLGWGARKEKTTTPPPGQTLELVAARQGEGWVELAWKSPVDGGKVAAYTIQRRLRPLGQWENVATSLERTCLIQNQERLKEWEWQVVAVNKSGEGMPSNIVMTVL